MSVASAQLQALATAVPRQRVAQTTAWALFRETPRAASLSKRARALVRAVLTRDNGIDTRHIAIEPLLKTLTMDAEALNHAFEQHAPALSAEALNNALAQAGLKPTDLDGLVICTCTGYICPGVTSHVAEKLSLDPATRLVDLVGLGCGAAIPALRTGAEMLAGGAKRIAVIAVEICSAAFFLNEDPGVIVSACLFGDGAAAAILAPEASKPALGQLSDFRSLHQPQHREALRFVNDGGYLANRLAREVPQVAAEAVETLFRQAYPADAAPPETLLAHPGGQDVLAAIRERLPAYPLAESAAVLRAYGNMSSPSVLFALRRFLDAGPSAQEAWLTAFGAGFSAHACRFHAG